MIAPGYVARLPYITPIVVTQEGFRWRNDDGTETTATWADAQDTDISLDLDGKTRLRVLLDATGDPDPTAYTLYYKNTLDSTWLPVQVGPDPWTPADLDLISWWDASDAGTITSSGGLVSQWNDKSGNGLHLAQSDDDDKPATGAVTQNGLNVVNFEYGTWSYLTADAGSDAIDVNPIYMYAAMKIIFTGNVYLGVLGMRVSASSYDSVTPNAVLYGGFGGYQMWTTGVGDVAEQTIQLDAHIGGVGVWRVVRMYLNGGAVGVGIDGGTPNTTTFTLPPSVARYLRMGSRMYTGNPPSEAGAEEGYAPIHVGEMILSHNANDAAAHAYLADKWGITMTGGVVVPRPVYIATSANITASGQPTTVQLTAPASKTTADFTVGRMWDDENGTDLIHWWNPLNLAANLWAWWDTSDAASITASAGAVSQLSDLSGNARHLTQATGTYQPTTGAATINGLNVFTYGTKVLTTGSTTINQPITVAMIVQTDGVSTNQRCLGSETFLGTTAGTNGRWHGGSSTTISSTVESNAAPHLLVGIFDGASSTLRVDRTQIHAADAGTNGWTAAAVLIGANSTIGGTGWRTQIGETVIATTAVAGTDLTNMENYLVEKWRI